MNVLRLGSRLFGVAKHSNGLLNRKTVASFCKHCKGDQQAKGARHSTSVLHSLGEQRSPLCPQAQNELICQKQTFGTSCIAFNSEPLSGGELKKAVDNLTDQFMEARELLDDARHSLGTVYFSEDMEDAETAVKETLQQYENLLNQLSPEQKQEVLRTIGLKMEELKAQGQALKDQAST